MYDECRRSKTGHPEADRQQKFKKTPCLPSLSRDPDVEIHHRDDVFHGSDADWIDSWLFLMQYYIASYTQDLY